MNSSRHPSEGRRPRSFARALRHTFLHWARRVLFKGELPDGHDVMAWKRDPGGESLLRIRPLLPVALQATPAECREEPNMCRVRQGLSDLPRVQRSFSPPVGRDRPTARKKVFPEAVASREEDWRCDGEGNMPSEESVGTESSQKVSMHLVYLPGGRTMPPGQRGVFRRTVPA